MKNRRLWPLLVPLFTVCFSLFSMQGSPADTKRAVDLADIEGVEEILATPDGQASLYAFLFLRGEHTNDSNFIRAIDEKNYKGLTAILRRLKPELRLKLLRDVRIGDELSPLFLAVSRYGTFAVAMKEADDKGYCSKKERLRVLLEENLVMIEAMIEGLSTEDLLEVILFKAAEYSSPLASAAEEGVIPFLEICFARFSPEKASDLVQNFKEAGRNLFELALFNVKIECANYLLHKVADRREKLNMLRQPGPGQGNTLLIYAIDQGLHEVVINIFKDLSPEEKVDVLMVDSETGFNLLNLSVSRHEKYIKYEGYSQKKPSPLLYGEGKLFDQSYSMMEEMLNNLLAKDRIEIITRNGKMSSALFLSANKGLRHVFQLFLRGLSDEQILESLAAEEKGHCLLHVSILARREAVSDHILDYLEKNHPGKIAQFFNQQARDGKSFLHKVISNGSTLLADRVLKLGASPMAQDKQGNTAMHTAALRNSARHILLLAQFDPLLSMPNEAGDTPLHVAAKNGSDDAIRALLDLKADLSVRNFQGQRAQDLGGYQTFLERMQNFQNHFLEVRGKQGRIDELQDKDPQEKLPALCLFPDADDNGALDVGKFFLEQYNHLCKTHSVRVKRAALPEEWLREIEKYRRGPKINFLSLAMHGRPFFGLLGDDEQKSLISVETPQFCPECFNGTLDLGASIFICACLAGKPMKEGANLLEIFAMLASPRIVIGSFKSFGPDEITTAQTLPAWDGQIKKGDENKTIKLQAIPCDGLSGYFWIKSLDGSGEQAQKWQGVGVLRSLRDVLLPEHHHDG